MPSIVTGKLPAKLGNEISDAIRRALEAGMQTDEAVCVVVSVAADYARAEYGNGYLRDLAGVVTGRSAQPLPSN
jgi:hypothetical protein